ncbi:MAG: tetratricopeptide repeat-containing sulfotransferase family protein [Stellaceae bacterium]
MSRTPATTSPAPAAPNTGRPRAGLSVDLGSLGEAGQRAQSFDLLRRTLDAGYAKAADAAKAGERAKTPPRQARAAREQVERGRLLLEQGQNAPAITVLRQAVRLDEDNAAAHHALGLALLAAGELAPAVTSLQRATGRKPDLAVAHRDLGTALDRSGRHPEAIEAYRRALALSPRLAGVNHRLGQLYELRGFAPEAIACYKSERAETTDGRLSRAWGLQLEGDFGKAGELLRKAIALDPAHGGARHALAGFLMTEGHLAQAYTEYETALRLNPASHISWVGLVESKKFTPADRPIVERLRSALAEAGEGEPRVNFHFALGKVLDDLGECAEAMQQLDQAHAVLARTVRLDQDACAARTDNLIARFTPELFAELGDFGHDDETPLLIVGMPRSGTTLCEQILSSHSAIAAGDELPFWAPYKRWSAAEGEDFTPETARRVAGDYLRVLRRIGPTAVRVTDKLPFNFERVGLLHVLFPRARIIHCRRDPISTCLSIYSTAFKQKFEFLGSKADLAFYYRHYARLMAHWRSVLPPDRYLEVDYERLIADREAETRRLIAFAGLEWEEACLYPEQNRRTVKTASAWQARQPVYTTSIERWRRYEPWLGELGHLLQPSSPQSGEEGEG